MGYCIIDNNKIIQESKTISIKSKEKLPMIDHQIAIITNTSNFIKDLTDRYKIDIFLIE